MVSSTMQAIQVRKRSGKLVDYQKHKISQVVKLCLINGCGRTNNEDTVAFSAQIADKVDEMVKKLTSPVNVEVIQDVVVLQLALIDPKAAQNFRSYREEHRKLREEVGRPEDVAAIRDDDHRFVGINGHAQRFQQLDKYSRFREDLGRRETYKETVDRVIGHLQWFIREHQPQAQITEGEWKEMEQAMLNNEACGSMRLMQMAGPAAERCAVSIYNCSFNGMSDLTYFNEMLYIMMQGTGSGFSVESEHVSGLPRIKRIRAEASPDVFRVPDTTEGWCDSLKFGMERWFEGHDVRYEYDDVRRAGTKLRTKGGYASGPEPLRELHDFTRRVIRGRQKGQLLDIDVHDISCKIGKIVQVGGVRRAACISLSDFDSDSMRTAKSGNWLVHYPHRTMANNSAVYEEKPSDETFMREWLNLVSSKSGERGIFNRGNLGTQMPERRRKMYGRAFGSVAWGTNPCFHPDTRINTQQGLVRIEDLYMQGLPNLVTSDLRGEADGHDGVGVKVRAATQVELTQKNAEIFELETSNGHRLRVTANHKFVTPDGDKRLDQLQVGETLFLQSGVGQFGGEGSYGDGFILGMLTGDGTFATQQCGNRMACVDLWGEKLELTDDCLRIVNDMVSQIPSRNNRNYGDIGAVRATGVEGGKVRIGSSRLYQYLCQKLGIETPESVKQRVPEVVWRGSRDLVVGYLRGFFATDGTVNVAGHGTSQTVSLRLAQSNADLLRDVQMLLQNFGVVSSVHMRREAGMRMMPDGNGGQGEYQCRAAYELIVSRPNAIRFESVIGLVGPKGRRLSEVLDRRGRDCRKPERFVTKVKSVTPAGCSDVFCLNEPETHTLTANGVVTRQCGEIYLHPRGQFCNLSLCVIRPDDTLERLKHKVRMATIFGTIQSAMTHFRYLRPIWKENCDRERLLGVDLLGALDNPMLRSDNPDRDQLLRELRDIAIQTNRVWAAKIGISESTAITCIKPGGNSSVRWNTGQSMSGWLSEHMIRNVEVGKLNPMYRFLRDSGVPWETSYRDPNTAVFSFPMVAPAGARVVSDVANDRTLKHRYGAIAQLEDWLAFKLNWTEHNPSVSIYVADDEWMEVGTWVMKHWEHVGGLAFFPLYNEIYPQAPMQPVTKERFDAFMAKFPQHIPWEKLPRYEHEDHTTSHQEFACTSKEGCMI